MRLHCPSEDHCKSPPDAVAEHAGLQQSTHVGGCPQGRGRLCRRLRALTGAACARAQLTFNNTLTYYYSEDAWMGCKFFQDTVRASTAGVRDFPDARVG